MKDFQSEWAILHDGIEKYERFSLVIKLVSVVTSVLCVAYAVNGLFAASLMVILWMQDGIWKTFQKRMETRILFIEQQLRDKTQEHSGTFQFYTQWQEQRQGNSDLVREYVLNALKPTVAYPYAVLCLLVVIF